MLNYDSITGSIYNAFTGFATGIQRVGVGNTDVFFVPGFIWKVIQGISLEDVSLWRGGLAAIIGVLSMTVMSAVLAVLAAFASMWGTWGYYLTKCIGMVFVPTLLFKPLSFLFDGWFKLFFGFLIYSVVARVNLVMVAILLEQHFNTSIQALGAETYEMAIDNWTDILSLGCFFIIGILALISTGKFAASIAGAGGGMSESIRGATMAVSKAASGGA